MQKNFISFHFSLFVFFKKKLRKVSRRWGVLFCLVWIEVSFALKCSRVERDLEKAQDVVYWVQSSPSFSSSPSTERAAYLLAELNLEAGFSSGFFGSGADRES